MKQSEVEMADLVSPEVEKVLRWLGTVVECRSLAGEISLPCARPAADG